MKHRELPLLYCPFASPVNRNADTVGAASLDWAEQNGLLSERDERLVLESARVGWLVGRTNPGASREALQVLADWCTWLFLQDDRFDEQRIGKYPDAVAAHYGRSYEVLAGSPALDHESPFIHILEELRERFLALAGNGWMPRFLRAVENSFSASVWEASNRARAIIPDLDAYMYYRPYSGGVYTLVAATELTETLGLPFHIYDHPYLQNLVRRAVNVICWANDIVSLAKELRQGDVHNLVVVLRQEYGGTLQEAITRAAALHNSEVTQYIDLEATLPDFGPHDYAVKQYITLQKAWMKGNLEWSYMSERYSLPQLSA